MSAIDCDRILDQVCQLMREAAQIIIGADRSGDYISDKAGHANFVTKYDKAVQDKLKQGLKEIMPEAAFIGEEGDCDQCKSGGYAFIVDPIDGTSNFIHGYDLSAISIGLVNGDERVLGAVYNPYNDQMYTAIRGEGAYLNGQPIHVSNNTLANSLVLFGTSPYYEEYARLSFDKAYEFLHKCVDLRRSGSAAVDLCTVARGAADMYFELKLQPWDQAAGVLIVEEAGGRVTEVDGSPMAIYEPCSVMATNGIIGPEVYFNKN